MTPSATGLELRAIVAGYDGHPILHDVGLSVKPGETLVVVGPNGSGKSTLMKAAVGLLRPQSGAILLGGADVTALDAPARAARGLAYVPQEANIFRNMTALENLQVGYEFVAARTGPGFKAQLDAMLDLFPEIRAKLRVTAGHLSGGQRQMVAMAAALMPRPSVLALDEPSAGLSPRNAEILFEAIARIAASGVTLLIVEQNTRLGLAAADHGIVLVNGRVRLAAPAAAVLADPDIRQLYLGGV